MLSFSSAPQVAERQMQAIIFYLTTFGYIDGDFDASEKTFVRDYIRNLVEQRVDAGMRDADADLKQEVSQKFTAHFHEVFENIDRYVRDLFTESVSKDENPDQFVHARLKLRCFEIFQSFDDAGRDTLLDAVDDLIHADGQVHPAELKFRGELADLLEAELGVEMVEAGARPSIELRTAVDRSPTHELHPFFDALEHHYSLDTETIFRQVTADRALIDRTIAKLDEQRRGGEGRLAGHQSVADFQGQDPFLDGHTYVLPAKAGRRYELTVLGDLHGCYSNLKAAILQSNFFQKLEAFRRDPLHEVEPKLVLLGDYIDRGMFSLNGVLRTVMQLFVAAPEHVYVLRGNHEYYLEFEGQIFGGVRPAEAIDTLKPHLSTDVFRHYMTLFDALPNTLLFDGMMFVHGGIPRDLLVKERWRDLSSLNDPQIRFQMMWSDPSSADIIPAQLQEQSARFPFGRLQAAAFLNRCGCHTMVRGHEKVKEGFRRNYDDEDAVLLTLFSAGGETNDDLPVDSSYRNVVPHALTVTWEDGALELTPWKLDYERYNDPEKNAFFKVPPQIRHSSA